MPTIITRISKFSGLIMAVCKTKTDRAMRHIDTPISGKILLLLVLLCNFMLAKLTPAKMSKNPALPIVEMLERFSKLAINKDITDVIKRPSIGLFQTFFPEFLVIHPLWRLCNSLLPIHRELRLLLMLLKVKLQLLLKRIPYCQETA